MNKRPRFYTSTGWLTPYALSCGYIETNEGYHKENPLGVSMEKDSACYHVKVFRNAEPLQWDSFDTLPEARRALTKAIKDHKQKHKKVLSIGNIWLNAFNESVSWVGTATYTGAYGKSILQYDISAPSLNCSRKKARRLTMQEAERYFEGK